MNLCIDFNGIEGNKKSKYSVCSTVLGIGIYGCVSMTYAETLMHTQVYDLQEVAE